MKYDRIRRLSPLREEVLAGKERMWLDTYRFPDSQTDLFEKFAQGKSMAEAEEGYRSEARNFQKKLDLLHLSDDGSHMARHAEYEVRAIPSQTGWQVEVLKPEYLTLAELRRYHTLTADEEKILADQLVSALKDAKKAGFAGRPTDENVYVVAENEYLLDCANLADGEPDLAELVRDDELKARLRSTDLYSWQ